MPSGDENPPLGHDAMRRNRSLQLRYFESPVSTYANATKTIERPSCM